MSLNLSFVCLVVKCLRPLPHSEHQPDRNPQGFLHSLVCVCSSACGRNAQRLKLPVLSTQVYALKKFTGDAGDDDDRTHVDEHAWRKYFVQPLECATTIVTTRKVGHRPLTARM